MLQQGPALPPSAPVQAGMAQAPAAPAPGPSIKAPTPQAGKNYFDNWLKTHPNASGLEQDVMKKAFGAEAPAAAPMPAPGAPAPAAGPAAPMPVARKDALGRALQTA